VRHDTHQWPGFQSHIREMTLDRLIPAPRVVSKPQDVGKSGNGRCFSVLLREDPMTLFNKQPRKWLHIDAEGHVSYVTVRSKQQRQCAALAAAALHVVCHHSPACLELQIPQCDTAAG